MANLEQQLRQHPFCASLKEEQIQALLACASRVEVPAGQLIVHQGASANHFYLLVQGRVTIELNAPPRGVITIQTLSPGDIMGWSWLTPPYRWRFDALAAESVTAIALDAQQLREKLAHDHELAYEMLKRFVSVMGQRLEASRAQLLDMYGSQR
jgi:CRP-like cAMP-binding protein